MKFAPPSKDDQVLPAVPQEKATLKPAQMTSAAMAAQAKAKELDEKSRARREELEEKAKAQQEELLLQQKRDDEEEEERQLIQRGEALKRERLQGETQQSRLDEQRNASDEAYNQELLRLAKDKEMQELEHQARRKQGAALINGLWSSPQCPKVSVDGESVTWDNGAVTRLQVKGANRFLMVYQKGAYTGELRSDGKVYWNDGDIWTRAEAYDCDVLAAAFP